MIGQTVAHYKILKKLGEGGMGVVYLAEDTSLRRTVALKFPPHHAITGDADRARFVREAQAAASLDHPNICAVHEINEAHGDPFIVMAYVDGRLLDEVIAQGPIAVAEALDLGIQLGRGLAAAHARGVIHRDIKPANVMITADGQAKIMDFGLARISGHTTRSDLISGTIYYMSPEQTHGTGVDQRTDIWALGATLYQMLAGRVPFGGDYPQAVVYAILNEPAQPIRSVNPGVPEEIDRIITKALAKDVANRYQSADEMVDDLVAVKAALATGSPARISAAARPRRRRSLFAAAVAVLIVAGVVAARFAFHSSSPPDARIIAVLPFENLGGNAEEDYFTDGITEDINTQLSAIGELTVLSRSAVRRYKNSSQSLREIAAELGVGSIVTGSIRRADGKIRISARLVDPRTERQIWSERYDREMKDIFSIQSDVAKRIADALLVQLHPEVAHRIETSPTASLTAYDYFLKGRGYYLQYNRQSNETAIQMFRKALELDPNYALAYTGLGNAYAQRTNAFGMGSEWVDSSIVVSQKALRINPGLAAAHKAAGLGYFVKGWLHRALQSTQTAVELDPNSAEAIANVAGILLSVGRCDEALPWARSAVTRNPGSAFYYSSVGTTLLALTEDGAAQQWFNKALGVQPDFAIAMAGIGYLHLNHGDAAKAKASAERIISGDPTQFFGLHLAGDAELALENLDKARAYYQRLLPASPMADYYSGKRPSTSIAYILWRQGKADSARVMIEESLRLDAQELKAGNEWPDVRYNSAAAYAVLGDTDRALEQLEQAVKAGWRLYRLGANDPLFESIRGDERFRRIIESVERDVRRMRETAASTGA
jgi:eukaryotic-like serine/threonine-protein kinase